MNKRPNARVTRTRPAGKDHAVHTLLGGRGNLYRKKPCPTCPWRVDTIGEFPAAAFVHSAPTSYDMADTVFACHSSGTKSPATCAGAILGTHHSLALRLKYANGVIDPDQVSAAGVELFPNYRSMAIANGVDEDDPALRRCR